MNVLNTTTLKNLMLLSHKNQAPLLSLLQNMVDNCPANITELQQNFQTSNFTLAKQALHKIRGSFATIGADAFASSCSAIEQELERESLPSAAEQTALFTLYQDSCQALQAFIQQHNNTNTTPETIVDLTQLLQFLEQHNMAATALANKGSAQLKQLLPAQDSQNFFTLLAQLDYAAAAELLRPHIVSKQFKQRKGD
ncbi:Hpt domain-containing protein [Rheinheimera sp. WS51]|uniref:Hpt domain-containing protein n=1 Tax=Rheinheimera sp. WS51 TaxID=3425886 RepID=UPI003D9280DF